MAPSICSHDEVDTAHAAFGKPCAFVAGMKRFLTALILAGGLAVMYADDVVVRVAPPRAVVEHRGRAPGRDYVWVPGYQRWDGNRYEWIQGKWDRPPHPGARWEAHRWVRRNGGWVMVEGRWR